MKKKEISRRHLLKGLMAAAGGLGLHQLAKRLDFEAMAQTLDNFVYLPIIFKGESEPLPPPATNGRVVHVHDPDATSWDFSTGWYGDYVNQTAVTAMVERGLMELTGTNSIQAAWGIIIPDYQPGQKIAIKVNFNNNGDCIASDSDNQIDALIHPVNALLATLVSFGVAEGDISVIEPSRRMPSRFYDRRAYSGVRFLDYAKYGAGCADGEVSFVDTYITFNHPNLSPRRLPDAIVDADYLINMPIMKDHGITAVTLGFKNHYGSINIVQKAGNDDLHIYIDPTQTLYDPNYSPLVDIYLSPQIGGKTVLTVGDGLYGALGNTRAEPQPWISFGNKAPNSLFFSADPVAVDCVMLDILYSENVSHPHKDHADDYLKLADNAGLGTHDRNYPWSSDGYAKIDYVRVEL
jgi:hypothetical protein